MLIAREWERGTFESLFVTPVRPFEIALAKVAPYLVIGIIDIAICLFAARFLFKVPIRGSLVLIVLVSILYLLVSLLMGLLVSGVTRNQFLASQMALLVSFMPAVMFSGFVFDLRNMPGWIQPICEIFPATHFMKVAKLLFLAGNDASVVSEGVLILLGYTILFLILTTWDASEARGVKTHENPTLQFTHYLVLAGPGSDPEGAPRPHEGPGEPLDPDRPGDHPGVPFRVRREL